MTAEYSSVDCQEVYGSSVETGDVFNGFSASVTLQCAWADRYALMEDLLGFPRYFPKSLGGLTAYAVGASARPMLGEYTDDPTSQMINNYDTAFVDVTYNTTITDVASETLESAIEAIPLSYSNFNWGGLGGPLLVEGEAPPLILKSLNLVRTRYRLTALPVDIINAVGMVNQFTYTSAYLPGLVFPSETLLFEPAPAQRSFTNFTSTGFTLTLKFGYKPQGWNKYWRSFSQSWESIYNVGSSTPNKSYPLYDFSALFS